MDSLEDWNDFRRNETPKPCKLVCCECGKSAQGNVSCDDGEICDVCHERDLATETVKPGPQNVQNVVDLWRSSQTTLRGGFKPRRHC